MADQPKYLPFDQSDFFADGQSSRPLVAGTVAREQTQARDHVDRGRLAGEHVHTLPEPFSPELLLRGRQRYEIFCAPCHDRAGNGQGMVVRRGFPRPPSFHIKRLRDARVGYLYDVISNGFGRMPDYASQIPVTDRWAIVAYVRALQLSQNAPRSDLAAEDLEKLQQEGP
jgi:hypothetical protein